MNQNNDATNRRRFSIGVADFSTSEPLLNAKQILRSGMDFIEPGLAKISALCDADFEEAVKQIRHDKTPVLSCNWFLPPDLKVVGPEVDESKCKGFLEHALNRAAVLGARAIVFGEPRIKKRTSRIFGGASNISNDRILPSLLRRHSRTQLGS